jgi:hypothetical protein
MKAAMDEEEKNKMRGRKIVVFCLPFCEREVNKYFSRVF